MIRCEVCHEPSRRRLRCPSCGRYAGPCCRPRLVRGGYRGAWECAECERPATPERPVSPETRRRTDELLRELAEASQECMHCGAYAPTGICSRCQKLPDGASYEEGYR